MEGHSLPQQDHIICTRTQPFGKICRNTFDIYWEEGLEDVATEKEKILALLVATCREEDADDDDDDDDDTMTNRLEDKNLGDRPQYPVAGRPLEPNFQKNFLFEI